MSMEAVAAFLYREARLIDEHRYQEWLGLWENDNTLYWVPCNEDDIDPRHHVSIIYDDHDRLMQRVERLLSGSVMAQQPVPKMRRVVSNIEPEQRGARADRGALEFHSRDGARRTPGAVGRPGAAPTVAA